MSRNLNTVKTFFDPHPGFAGAIIPIPTAVKKVADELNGKSMPLGEAVNKIQAVTNGEVEIVEKYNFIALKLRETNGIKHCFRVIKFR